MTRLVAFDTSTWWGGVALVESGPPTAVARVVGEAGLRVRDSHAAHLLSLLSALLAEAGWSPRSVDGYASTRGPGSFTGLRVGLGTIRGLALAAARPCLGVGTLIAMAEAFGPAEGDRVPLIDAGRGEVFGARFDAASTPPSEKVEPWLGRPERALEGLTEASVIFGSPAELLAGRLRGAGFAGRIARAPASIAAAAGRIAASRLAGGALDGEGMEPLYLRPPDAEIHPGPSDRPGTRTRK